MNEIQVSYDTKEHEFSTDGVAVDKLSLSIGGKKLLDSTKLVFAKGTKYGLIGYNGSGKTTLIKVIGNRKIPMHEKIRVVEIEQLLTVDHDTNICHYLLMANRELWPIYQQVLIYEGREVRDDELDEYSRVQELYSELSGDRELATVKRILSGLGFVDLNKKISELSGGWQRRLALAKALYMPCEVLLLDEPTNHLDLEAVLWLINYLSEYEGIVVSISHSSDFLDYVCDEIIHIEDGKLAYYTGNYSCFKDAYAEKIRLLKEAHNKLVKKVIEWKKMHKKKEEIAKELEKPQNILTPLPKTYNVKFPFRDANTISHSIIRANSLSFKYPGTETPLFSNVDFDIRSGSKIAILGNNGTGKSTLLKILAGEIETSEGEVYKNPNLRIGYYHQHFDKFLPEDETPMEYLKRYFNDDFNFARNTDVSLRQHLGALKLSQEAHHQKIGSLSGGQKARIAFLKTIFEKPHMFIFDEPTNHLDLETVEALIDALKAFDGTFIVVTHDPTLITKLELELYEIKNNKVSIYRNSFDEYMREKVEAFEA